MIKSYVNRPEGEDYLGLYSPHKWDVLQQSIYFRQQEE